MYLKNINKSMTNLPISLWTCLVVAAWKTEKAMAPHSSTLAWKIPWTEEPGGLQSMGSQRVGQDWATFTYLHIHFYFDWIQEIRLKIISGELFFSHVKTGICKNTTEETNYLLDYNVNKLLESEGFLRVGAQRAWFSLFILTLSFRKQLENP